MFLIFFMLSMLIVGFRRPFIYICAYIYIDIVSPQRLSYYYLSVIPISLIVFCAAIIGWAMADDKRWVKPSPRQVLLILVLLLCGYTTLTADFPDEAVTKWEWVWKALVFAIFMPVTLYTRVRIEAVVLFMLISISSITIVGGIKTLAGGGGYGTLNLMVSSNSGLYEGSTISVFAICSIPLALFAARYSTLIVPSIFSRIYWYGLAFACLLIPIGTQARTGLLCIAMLAVLHLRAVKRKMLYLALLAGALAAAVPFLPDTYTKRMDTIQGYKGDASASTRLAVWKWTIDYAKDHPFGGGFNAYIGNKLEIDMSYKTADGTVVRVVGYDAGRAYHNSYFEMLGEQGYPGLALFLLIHLIGVIRMENVQRSFKDVEGNYVWVAPLAKALQASHLVFLLGCSFVGIAFQPFIYLIVALEISLDRYAQTYVKRRIWNPFRKNERSEPQVAPPPEEGEPAQAAPAPVDEGFAPQSTRRREARWGSVPRS